ncbi:MAG TPA: Xaa-Pro aminopeptidase, partial [Erysipelothrix sp.]|nr:Xaa-Pro aminopeptidase [Erysipelothrix sp.]
RMEIKELYPELYARFEKRQKYLREELGINISDDILPMASTVGYMRPLMLDHDRCLVKVSDK